MKDETRLVTGGRKPEKYHGVVNVPVFHTSTIIHESVQDMRDSGNNRGGEKSVTAYGRVGHPTSLAFEEAVAELEGGYKSFAFPSGLAAISTALTSYLSAGDHVLITDSAYFPTRRVANLNLARFGVDVTYYDPLIGAGIEDLIRPNTKVVYTEAPGSHTFDMQDIPAIAEVAHRHGAVVMMDNTWASPLYFKPFEHGVDVSIHAATKYLVGHSDAMLGVVTTNREHWDPLREMAQILGQCVGPDDIYLGQRGMRTLSVRLERHQKNALEMATWLQSRPEVDRVLYPALPDFPGHDIWKRDFLGASGLFSIVLKPVSDEAVQRMLDGYELFGIGASWGGFESLVISSNPATARSATTWGPENGPLVRYHIGLEDPEDLKADMVAGFDRLTAE